MHNFNKESHVLAHHRQQQQRNAEEWRLQQQATRRASIKRGRGLYQRVLAGLGIMLSSAGNTLQARYSERPIATLYTASEHNAPC